jgi:hypothetical protein
MMKLKVSMRLARSAKQSCGSDLSTALRATRAVDIRCGESIRIQIGCRPAADSISSTRPEIGTNAIRIRSPLRNWPYTGLSIWKRRRGACSYALRAATLACACLLVSPYLYDYNLTWYGILIAWYARFAWTHGWRRFDREWLMLLWLMPLVTLASLGLLVSRIAQERTTCRRCPTHATTRPKPRSPVRRRDPARRRPAGSAEPDSGDDRPLAQRRGSRRRPRKIIGHSINRFNYIILMQRIPSIDSDFKITD